METAPPNPHDRLVDCYGVMVSISSEEHRAACEARYLLSLPLEERRALIKRCVEKRCRGIHPTAKAREEAMAAVRKRLEEAILREWNWRQRPQPDDRQGSLL